MIRNVPEPKTTLMKQGTAEEDDHEMDLIAQLQGTKQKSSPEPKENAAFKTETDKMYDFDFNV